MREADPRSPERGQYAFVQGIIREVAYGMLSKADRRARHLAVAHHFEAAGDDELAGVVARALRRGARARPRTGPTATRSAPGPATGWGRRPSAPPRSARPTRRWSSPSRRSTITPAGRSAPPSCKAPPRRLTTRSPRGAGRLPARGGRRSSHGLGDVNAEMAAWGLLASALGDDDRVDELRAVVEQMRLRVDATTDALRPGRVRPRRRPTSCTSTATSTASLASLDRALAGYEQARAWDRFHGGARATGRHC